MITTPLRFERWVPSEVRADVLRGLPEGLTKYASEDGAEIAVVVRELNGFRSVELYQYFPEDEAYYLAKAGGDIDQGRILRETMLDWNRGMRHLVEERGWSPGAARAELIRINDEVFKLTVEAAMIMLTSGAALSAVRRTATIELPERSLSKKPAAASPKTESIQSIELEAESLAAAKPVRGAPELGGFAHGISEKEITAINRNLGGVTEIAAHPSSAIAAASHQTSFWGKSAAIIREIAGRHMFNDANKRTAQAVIEELMRRNSIASGVMKDEMRRVIHRVATGELREIADIARALRGF